MKSEIEQLINNSAEIIKKTSSLSGEIQKVINEIIRCLKNGNKVIIFGNGGSAADAQHIAAEFIGRFELERKSLAAIALTTDTSVITSLSNDYDYDVVFSRQCESLVSKGDVVIGISTSGNSKNVYEGLKTSKNKGALIITLLGNKGGKIKELSDISIIVDSSITSQIQEAHRVIYHIICKIVERQLSEK
jgi:D-sedoheptulose 7-phosphate isomerase